MPAPIHHSTESSSNTVRDTLVQVEPRGLRTFTPTQAVLLTSAGVFHWTQERRRLKESAWEVREEATWDATVRRWRAFWPPTS